MAGLRAMVVYRGYPIMAQNGWTIPHAGFHVQHAMRMNAFSVQFHDLGHVVNHLQRIIYSNRSLILKDRVKTIR